MFRPTRTLVAIAGLAVFAVPSQAVITFSNYTGDFTVGPSNQISSTPPNLSNFVSGPTAGTVTEDSGHFFVSSSSGLTALDVNEVDGFSDGGGTVTLTVSLYATLLGVPVGPPVQTLYYGDTNNTSADVLTPITGHTYEDNGFLTPLTGTYYVSYAATFNGNASSDGYLGGFAVEAFEGVPEPSAYAALGVGLIGLLVRGRRSRK